MKSRMTRGRLIALAAAALLAPGCSSSAPGRVRVGSTDSPENATIAEIYALALERANFRVERHMNFGTPSEAMDALERADIDLYPHDVPAENRDGLTSLRESAMTEGTCLATTQYAAEKYWLVTLGTCSELAAKLRFAATPDFLMQGGGLERLQQSYGGFTFKQNFRCEPGDQYDVLSRGDADVASGFSTDPQIAEKALLVLGDERRVFPRTSVAPLVRNAVLRAHPRVRNVLNRVSSRLSTYAVQQINMHLDLLYMEPRDVAEQFLGRR